MDKAANKLHDLVIQIFILQKNQTETSVIIYN